MNPPNEQGVLSPRSNGMFSPTRDRPHGDWIAIDMKTLKVCLADAAGRGRILLPAPPSSIYSLGVGVRWNAVFGESLRWNPEFEMYWGKSLVDANPTCARSGSLQDSGIHFSVGLQVF